MKNPFHKIFSKKPDTAAKNPSAVISDEAAAAPKADAEVTQQKPVSEAEPSPAKKEPADTFILWCRSKTRGGVERRERSDIYEAYNAYGTDNDTLVCRCYHRYPEHEKDFSVTVSRTLTFDEFNTRLLCELDKGDLTLPDYKQCIEKAAVLSSLSINGSSFEGFHEEETSALRAFCDAIDILGEKSCLSQNGVFCCEGKSVVGDEPISICFRRPFPFDAMNRDTAGVQKEEIDGWDIDNMWLMGVYNRIRENTSSHRLFRLTSQWSLNKETVLLLSCEDFSSLKGTVLIAAGSAEDLSRFGFYSLGFSG